MDGSAVRAEVPSPQVQSLLDARDLDRILLGDDELNEFMSSTEIEVTKEPPPDDRRSASVSEPACLGAVYTAEEPIYKDTGYTAVHTRLAREPDEYGFTVEQTGVILPSVEAAEKFVDDSAQAWSDCAAMELSVTDGQEWHDWDLQDVVRDRGNRQSTIQVGGVDRLALSALDRRGGQRDRRGDGVWCPYPRRREVDGPRDDRKSCRQVAHLAAA